MVPTNCSNNYGTWQFPEKLIPVVILKAAAEQPIPLYGDGATMRDWLYVDDHVDAVLLAATRGRLGHDRRYAIDASKISYELGWRPRNSLEEDLEANISW